MFVAFILICETLNINSCRPAIHNEYFFTEEGCNQTLQTELLELKELGLTVRYVCYKVGEGA